MKVRAWIKVRPVVIDDISEMEIDDEELEGLSKTVRVAEIQDRIRWELFKDVEWEWEEIK